MAIRNIAHSIQAGEISLGVAVGVESMSLKYVRLHTLHQFLFVGSYAIVRAVPALLP